MYIFILVLGIILVLIALIALFSKLALGSSQQTYDDILKKLSPYLDSDDNTTLVSILEAIDLFLKGKKEIKTSSNTATISKYQRKAEVLLSNIGELVFDISNLDDFKNEDQIKKYVKGNVKKLITKSGLEVWSPQVGVKFDPTLMFSTKSIFADAVVTKVLENGYKSDGHVVIKALVEV